MRGKPGDSEFTHADTASAWSCVSRGTRRFASIERGFVAGMRPESIQKLIVAGPRPTRSGKAPVVPLAGTPLASAPWHDAQFCWKSASPIVTNADDGARYVIEVLPYAMMTPLLFFFTKVEFGVPAFLRVV